MGLSYRERLKRGWGLVIDLILVALHCQILFLVAFLPCYVLAFIGEAYHDTLPTAVLVLGAVVGLAYGVLVAPVVLFHLVQAFGSPWRWVEDRWRTKATTPTTPACAPDSAVRAAHGASLRAE
jgi:hypothetical protein